MGPLLDNSGLLRDAMRHILSGLLQWGCRSITADCGCIFRRIRSPSPKGFDHSEGFDQGSERSDELGLVCGLDGRLRFESFLTAHRGTAQSDDVGVVHKAVTDGVGDCGVSDGFMRTFRRQLRREYR